MNKQIVLIDYEVGNIHSIQNALELLGYRTKVSRKADDIHAAQALILPGVGSFGEAMGNLMKFNLIDVLNHAVLHQGKPILGICLGMQILTESSEEDPAFAGLGWIPGKVIKVDVPNLRVPHVGWNELDIHLEAPLFSKHENTSHYYFDHSYHFTCSKQFVAASAQYGIEVIAAVQKENIYGVQFHPEKSYNNGLKLFRSFFNHHGF